MKKLIVTCVKSTGGAFMVGQEYTASLMKDGNWKVKGIDGFEYGTTLGLYGRIGYVSMDRKEKFIFEPVMK